MLPSKITRSGSNASPPGRCRTQLIRGAVQRVDIIEDRLRHRGHGNQVDHTRGPAHSGYGIGAACDLRQCSISKLCHLCQIAPDRIGELADILSDLCPGVRCAGPVSPVIQSPAFADLLIDEILNVS